MFLLTERVVIKLGTFLDFLCGPFVHVRVSAYLIIGFWVGFGWIRWVSLPISRIIAFQIVAEWVVDVILLQVGLKCCSMRMIFDFFYKLLNSEMFCFLDN